MIKKRLNNITSKNTKRNIRTYSAVVTVSVAAFFGLSAPTFFVNAQSSLSNGYNYGAQHSESPSTTDCAITVLPGESIQSALNGSSNTTICAAEGSYPEVLTITGDNVRLRAVGSAKIKGAELQGTNQTIDGFIVEDTTPALSEGDRAGISLNDTANATVINNTIRSHSFTIGVHCLNRNARCDNNLIANNSIYDIEGYGIWISGTSNIVEFNDIHSLYRSTPRYDVDGIRFFGSDHVIRNNYIHDIDQDDSVAIGNDTPHVDCFQTYTTFERYNPTTNPIHNNNILIENNFCINVSRQCLILENNDTSELVTYDITFRDNVCDVTEDNQVITLKGVDSVNIENNLLLMRNPQYQVIYAAAGGNNGRQTVTNTAITNNILVRPTASVLLYNSSSHSNLSFRNNHEVTGMPSGLDQSKPDLYSQTFLDNTTIDASVTPRGGYAAKDINGNARVNNTAADIGPFEFYETDNSDDSDPASTTVVYEAATNKQATLTAIPQGSSLDLSWNKVSGATRYQVSYRLIGKKWSWVPVTAEQQTTLTNLTPAIYEVRVRAYIPKKWQQWNGGSVDLASTPTDTGSTPTPVTEEDPIDSTPDASEGETVEFPASGSNQTTLRLTPNANRINVTWDSITGGKRYQISYKRNGGTWQWHPQQTQEVNSITLNSLRSGDYQVRIRVYKNGTWNSWNTGVVTVR